MIEHTGGGLYVLLLAVQGSIEVGKLGELQFDEDRLYLYIGSARGPGGFKRVRRHLAVALGERQTRRWHIDYLLAAGELQAVWLIPNAPFNECALVRKLIAHGAAPAIPGFGASDSECETHLLQVGSPEVAEAMLSELARELGLQLEFRPLRPDRTPPTRPSGPASRLSSPSSRR